MARRMVYGDDSSMYINHDGIIHETKSGVKDEGAMLISIHGEQRWVPKSQITDYNDEIVAVKRWWGQKNGLKGDWESV